jgi:hypothetical protein
MSWTRLASSVRRRAGPCEVTGMDPSERPNCADDAVLENLYLVLSQVFDRVAGLVARDQVKETSWNRA